MSLTIKALGIRNAPVRSSASERALDNGVIHEPDTSLPWDEGVQRNVYLVGHRLGWPGTGSHRIFYNLDKLATGDTIVLRDSRGHSFEYRVTGSLLVGPEDSWVKDVVPGRDMLSLQTCTPIATFEKRLIVRAERVSATPRTWTGANSLSAGPPADQPTAPAPPMDSLLAWRLWLRL